MVESPLWKTFIEEKELDVQLEEAFAKYAEDRLHGEKYDWQKLEDLFLEWKRTRM